MNSTNSLPDLRVRRTNKFLWDALMSLMAERDFDSVSVSDICERALVHRTTFYKHYEDKQGLLQDGIHEELNLLFAVHDSAVSKPLEKDKAPDTMARFARVFEHVLKHERFYRLMLTGNGVGKFSALLRRSLAERFERQLQGDARRSQIPISLDAQIHASAMIATLSWWLENDCPYSPVEMTQRLERHLMTRLHLHEPKH